jgi:cytochrome oxidase Cu insertion factor (SCO1/SenC/PrrC family)
VLYITVDPARGRCGKGWKGYLTGFIRASSGGTGRQASLKSVRDIRHQAKRDRQARQASLRHSSFVYLIDARAAASR